MGPVGFALAMACSVAVVYFTMAVWLFQLCRERPLDADLGFYRVNPAGITIGQWCLHGVTIRLSEVGGVR